MEIARVRTDDLGYPTSLKACLKDSTPPVLFLLGNQELLTCRPLGIFCSVQCPGALILKTYDLACALRDAGVPVISGFHSPMEKECLRLLLRGIQPVLICLARGIERMRIPPDWKKPLAEDRLLILSGFLPEIRRVTAELAQARNRIAAALADKVFVVYASPGSRTETFCRDVIGWGKLLFSVDSKENQVLLNLGAVPISSNAPLVPSIMDSVLF
jgi:predicted Rossmann fold nucleotide-binding protein DprA/Smf involved in DNA uptake